MNIIMTYTWEINIRLYPDWMSVKMKELVKGQQKLYIIKYDRNYILLKNIESILMKTLKKM